VVACAKCFFSDAVQILAKFNVNGSLDFDKSVESEKYRRVVRKRRA